MFCTRARSCARADDKLESLLQEYDFVAVYFVRGCFH